MIMANNQVKPVNFQPKSSKCLKMSKNKTLKTRGISSKKFMYVYPLTISLTTNGSKVRDVYKMS